MITSFRQLTLWQKAMDLAADIYSATEALPRSEAFGLTSQIRLAAVSIPSNLAEGKAIGGQGYRRHTKIALGSEAELQTQIELAMRLNMLKQAEGDALLERISRVGKILVALLNSLPKT